MAKGILQKLAEASKDLKIAKTGFNEAHSYDYFTQDDIINSVASKLEAKGIVESTNISQWSHDISLNERGSQRKTATAIVDYIFSDSEDGSTHTVQVTAEGADIGGDSASVKLMAQARKSAYKIVFRVSEGRDDADGAAPEKVETGTQTLTASTPDNELSRLRSEISKHTSGSPEKSEKSSALGDKLSKGKPRSEWAKDVKILTQILEAFENKEI